MEVQSIAEAVMNIKLRAMVVGCPGSGKTHFASTCPKVYYMGFSLGESDTFIVKPELKNNVVKVANLVPSNNEDLKLLFGDLDKGVEDGLIHDCIREAKELYLKGEIETLVIDTITYLVDYLWQYVNVYCKKYSKDGALDTRGMYGDLNTKLSRLIGLNILSFPGNLICCSHEMLESDEALEKKPDKSNPIVANILGGFRNKIEGMFSIVMYLAKVEKSGNYQYWARCNKGNNRNAKSRIPLPPTIPDISYTKIMNTIKECIKKEEGKMKSK